MSLWSVAKKFGGYVTEGISQAADFVGDLNIPGVSQVADFVGNVVSGFAGVASEQQAQKQQQQQFEKQLETQKTIAENNLAYQKEYNQLIMDREDNALQRGVADAEAAGLSPLAATGAGSGGSTVVPTTQDYSESAGLAARGVNPLAGIMQGLQARAAVAQVQKLEADIKATEANTEATEATTAKTFADIKRNAAELALNAAKFSHERFRDLQNIAFGYESLNQQQQQFLLGEFVKVVMQRAQQVHQTSEREASQAYQTSEREAAQKYQAEEAKKVRDFELTKSTYNTLLSLASNDYEREAAKKMRIFEMQTPNALAALLYSAGNEAGAWTAAIGGDVTSYVADAIQSFFGRGRGKGK